MMKKWLALMLCILLLLTSAMAVGAVPEEESTETTQASGDIFISMEINQQDDGTMNVVLLDDRGGVVSMWPVVLMINGEEVERVDTDMAGSATFYSSIPADATDVVVKALDGEFAGTVFVGCSMTVDASGEAQPIDSEQTESTDPESEQPEDEQTEGEQTEGEQPEDEQPADVTEPTETPAVNVLVSTMAMVEKDTRVGVGVDVDAALVSVSNTASEDWMTKAMLWMDKAHYASLVSDPNATLHLQLNYNSQALTSDRLIAAKNAHPDYASYADEEVVGFAIDPKMIYIDGTNRIELAPTDNMYTVEIPLPATMYDCDKVAVGVCTVDGVDSFLQIKPSNGMIKFSVKRFQTMAIVGFGTGNPMRMTMNTSPILVIIGGVGFALIALGIFLIIFFALRRHKAAVIADQDNDAKDVTRKVMLSPTAEVVVGTGDGSDKEEVESPVLLHYDEQSDLTREERALFRAKEGDPVAIERLSSESVPPAHQIDPSQVNAAIPESPQPVDELLSELDELLAGIDEELR